VAEQISRSQTSPSSRGLAWTNHHAAADGGGPDERLMHESAAVTASVKYCINIRVRAWGRSTSAPGFPRHLHWGRRTFFNGTGQTHKPRINRGAAQVMNLLWLPYQAHRYATFGRAHPHPPVRVGCSARPCAHAHAIAQSSASHSRQHRSARNPNVAAAGFRFGRQAPSRGSAACCNAVQRCVQPDKRRPFVFGFRRHNGMCV
jgi:hypothetical protein